MLEILPKIINFKGNKNKFSHINREIEIDLVNIIANCIRKSLKILN